MPARNSCNIHGHHNRNHCIIIHLNTRNFCNYSSWLTPLPRSDNPLQKIRTKCQRRSRILNNSARASRRTKTYSPFKRTFLLPQQLDWETNIQPSKTRPFQERVFDESKLESPCKYNRQPYPKFLPKFLVEMDGIEPTTPCLQSRCSTN